MKTPEQAESSKPARSRRRNYGAKILLLSVTVGLCLLMMEWTIRRLFPYYRPGTQIPFQLTTNGVPLGPAMQTVRQSTPKGDFDSFVRFNQYGFRDGKDLREAKEVDWFALGDSYTLGWGVEEEERFANRLEQAFKTNGIPSRVFNIAIPENIIGYQRLLNYAESRGAKVGHLIVGLCMENDLRDYTDGMSDWDPMRKPVSAVSTKESARRWLKSHSALYIASSFALQRLSLARGLLERAGVARDIDALTGNNEWSETVLKSSRNELVKLVAGRDALILIIPSRHLWHGPRQETERRVHESFVSLLREAGLQVLDIKNAIESEGDPMSCYFKTDSHWNARGHDVAARELFRAIRAREPK